VQQEVERTLEAVDLDDQETFTLRAPDDGQIHVFSSI
jgi:hypothetical protein